jgi:GT2 family glycosyltransferase
MEENGQIEFSFIVPYLNKWGLTHRCLAEFYKFLAGERFEVVLVDDGSTDVECLTGLKWWLDLQRPFPITAVKHENNLGFGKSMNDGADAAIGEILIFYSNDVRMEKNILPDLRDLINMDRNVLIGNEVIYYPAGWNEFELDGKKFIIPYANGWFLACTREVWTNLGGFDYELFGRFDYEDVDLSTRAYELGYNVVALNSRSLVHAHQGSTVSSLNVDRLKVTQKNREKYFNKWKDKFSSIYEVMEKNAKWKQSSPQRNHL